MTQASWSFVATDPNSGAVIDYLDCPADATYTRRLDDYCEFGATITAPKDFFSIQPYSSAIMCLRNGNPIFRGRIVDPFERSPRTRTIVAKDPFHNMYWRRVREHLTMTAQPDDMAWELMALQNTYRDTGLRDGSDHAWGDAVLRKFLAGDVVADEARGLAMTHGNYKFHFKINAVLDEADPKAMAHFATFREIGPLRDGARFEFGGNTLENVQDYHVEYGQPINRATTLGARNSSRDVIGKALTSPGNCVAQTATATTSKDPPEVGVYVAGESEYDYGLWEDEYSQVTKSGSHGHLRAISRSRLYPEPPRTITVTPSPEGPALFDDFDVGDRVHVRIYDYDFTLDAIVTVWEVVVKVDPESGQEMIETISFVDPLNTGPVIPGGS